MYISVTPITISITGDEARDKGCFHAPLSTRNNSVAKELINWQEKYQLKALIKLKVFKIISLYHSY